MNKKAIVSQYEAELMMANCDCNGWDIVTSQRKASRTREMHGACLCGQVRGYRLMSGQWTVIKDAPRILSVVPKAVPESELDNGCKTVSGKMLQPQKSAGHND